ncbi:MAG: carbonic anhydrase [Bdellovibrionota bacterium]
MFPTRLRLYNKAWVANRLELNVKYFERMAEGQSPQALWIGCCDSRAPAEEITGARPGELFVHRNIANLVRDDDPSFAGSCFTHLKYKVPHVIICGHTNCGGVPGPWTTTRNLVFRTGLHPYVSW